MAKKKKPKKSVPREPQSGEEMVFTSYITLKNGRRLYASECGKTCFAFPVKKKPKE